jgi:hypothetical protein
MQPRQINVQHPRGKLTKELKERREREGEKQGTSKQAGLKVQGGRVGYV